MHESPWQRRVADFGRRIPAPLILVFALVLLQLSSGTAKIIMTPENALGLEYLVLKRIEPRVFGVLLSLEPAIATVVGIFLLFEIPSPMSWLAIAAVTTASIGATLGRVAHGPQESR